MPFPTHRLMPGLDPGIQTEVPFAPPMRAALDRRGQGPAVSRREEAHLDISSAPFRSDPVPPNWKIVPAGAERGGGFLPRPVKCQASDEVLHYSPAVERSTITSCFAWRTTRAALGPMR